MYLVKMLLMKKLASTMKTRKIEEEVFSGDDDTDYHHTSDDEDIEVQEDEATDTASKNYLPNTFVQQRHPFSTFFYYFIGLYTRNDHHITGTDSFLTIYTNFQWLP